MRLEQSFEVAAPLERVWQTLIDVEHVAPCLPGAAVTGRNEDGSYSGTFTVKIGPTTASYSGRLEMEAVDETAHTATMQAQGTDKRGQGGAKATIYSRVVPVDGTGTRVDVVTDYHITGRLARFGRGGMIEDISERLLREFARRLQSSLAAQPEAAPVSAGTEAEAAPEPAWSQAGSRGPDGAPPEAPVSPAADVAPSPAEVVPPPPSEEPVEVPAPAEPASAPAGAWSAPAGIEASPAGTEPWPAGTQPSPAGIEASPAGIEASPAGDGPGPVSGEPAGQADQVTPPPPPSPGPPPVVTPPPAAPPPPPPAPPRPESAEPPPPLEHALEPSEPIQGLSLVGSVVWTRVKRNPAPAAAAGMAVMLLLARRRRRRGAGRS